MLSTKHSTGVGDGDLGAAAIAGRERLCLSLTQSGSLLWETQCPYVNKLQRVTLMR